MKQLRPDIYVGLPSLNQSLVRKGRKQSDPDLIIERVCECLNITRGELYLVRRTRNLVEARCIVVGLILEIKPDFGLKRLGLLLGGKHHSSIIHMNRMFNVLYHADKPFTKKVEKILDYV